MVPLSMPVTLVEVNISQKGAVLTCWSGRGGVRGFACALSVLSSSASLSHSCSLSPTHLDSVAGCQMCVCDLLASLKFQCGHQPQHRVAVWLASPPILDPAADPPGLAIPSVVTVCV